MGFATAQANGGREERSLGSPGPAPTCRSSTSEQKIHPPVPTVYLLPNCKTCQRVHADLEAARPGAWRVRDIKAEPLTEGEVDELARLAGGYEPLFSRRAVLYRQRGLKEQTLGEDDYRRLMLEHYTFLKRPVMRVGDELFVGSAGKTVAGAIAASAPS